MGAIIKTIPIHSSDVNPLLKYCGNKDKTSVSKGLLENPDLNISAALNYAANPLKTICNIDENHKEILTTGIKCEPLTAAQEFAMTRQKYRELSGNIEKYEPFEYLDRRSGKMKSIKRKPVTAMHVIQSFNEKDLDPHLVHQMGVEMLERLGLQGVVDTHLNKEHLHNHIIINTYKPDGTKWNCNLEERMRIRELSDDIQREYGIEITFDNPKEQLAIAKGHYASYKEWDAVENGISWKEQMRNDIGTIRSVAKDRNEYLSLMEAYGYKVVNEGEKVITFYIEGLDKKINDKSLGSEYCIGVLYPPSNDKKLEYEENEHALVLHKDTLYVARYNADGTKRGFLEMLIRKAIAAIQRLMGLGDDQVIVYTTYTPKNKIEMLNEALDVISNYKIETHEDLAAKLNEAGKQLSQVKTKMKKMESEKGLYDNILAAIEQIENLRVVDTKLGHLDLHVYSDKEIRKTRAKFAPLSPSEKSAIAVELFNHQEYKLNCQYNELTPSEAAKIISFLRGENVEQPELLLTAEEFEKKNVKTLADKIYESRKKSLDERFGNTPADKQTIEQINKLLKSKGIDREFTELSQAAVMDIRNCYSINPFSSPIINEAQQETLLKILNNRNLKLNRPINYVTEKEASQLLGYLKDPQKYTMPNILKEHEAAKENDIENAKRIMENKGITTTVPLSLLSKPDFDKLYTYLISEGRTPQVLLPYRDVTNQERDDDFAQRMEMYQTDRILYLTQYRDALNVLRSCGYDVDQSSDFTKIKNGISEWMEEYLETLRDRDITANLYQDLIKTKNIIDKTKEHDFIYGKRYVEPLEIVVQETEERATIEEEQREKTAREEREKENKAKSKRKARNTVR